MGQVPFLYCARVSVCYAYTMTREKKDLPVHTSCRGAGCVRSGFQNAKVVMRLPALDLLFGAFGAARLAKTSMLPASLWA